MSHSLNEIGAMCKRASRGGGLGWGLAEDAANGARWLSALGLPGPRMLALGLRLLDGEALGGVTPVSTRGRWHGAAGRLCPIVAGAALSDRAEQLATDPGIEMEHVLCPLLSGPFAGDAARRLQRAVSVEWEGIRLTTDGHRLSIEGDRDRLTDGECRELRCRVAQALPAPFLSPALRGRVDVGTQERLAAFAERTLAPATEESHRRGAGGDTR